MRKALGMVAAAAIGLMAGQPLPATMYQRPRDERDKERETRKRKSPGHYAKHDPFYGIPSTGRNGATLRMRTQLARFRSMTTVGKRAAIGRPLSAPFHSRAQNKAFVAFRQDGKPHNEAMKLARRVAA